MKGLRGVQFHLWVVLIFALTAASFIIGVRNQSVKCIAAERRALLDFKVGLDDEYNRLSSWTSKEEDCCRWKGVGCDKTTGHVVVLDLPHTSLPMGLGGEIGSSLLELKRLSHLYLSCNNFKRIPKFIGLLTELTYLDLSYNPLSGFIPYQLGNLSSLLYLGLGSIESSMITDNLDWVSGLSSLKTLQIGGTDFTKATNWLQVIQSHPSLSVLHLDYCDFPEVDPSSLSRFNSSNSLTVLQFTSSFSFPSTFLLLNISSKLIELDLCCNSLSSLTPDYFELKHLSHLDLSFNNFKRIPEFIASLTELSYLDFSYNPLSGLFPYQLGDLSRLLYLGLGGPEGSMITDNLDWLSGLSSLKRLEILGTNFTKATNWLQVIQSHSSLSDLYLYFCDFAEVDPSSLSPFNSSNSLAVLQITSSLTLHPSTFPLLLNISSNLVDLDLPWNNLSSSIPDSFQNMPALKHINFQKNRLEGGIPKSLGNLCNLKELDLWENMLCEDLTVILENLSGCAKDSLETLELGSNDLNGSLPNFVSFSSLRELYLQDNRFTGPLPDLSRLSSLTGLFLADNRLEGPFPVNYGKMSQLVSLDVSSNSLNGVISEAHLFNLSNLLQLSISFNSFSLNLSSDWIPPFQLDSIEIGSCDIGPQFPGWLRRQTNFSSLDISHNKISETIPYWFWNLSPRLLYLNLSFNNISGSVPDLPLNFDYIRSIDLSSNQFYGPIPQFFSNSSVLYLSNNMFSGPLSFLCTEHYNGLGYLDLSNNMLSGSIPDCQMNLGLAIINLENNNLSGIIPNSVGSLQELRSLRLRNTSLYGELPQSLQNCTDLKLLDLGENKLTGTIPLWLGERLESLIVLRLRSNVFHGNIPSTLCRQQFLQILDLSLNNISGTIPSCLNNLTAMAQLESPQATIQLSYDVPHYVYGILKGEGYTDYDDYLFVLWKGVEQKYGKTLGLLKIIDLSSNKLSGEIPREIASLQGLISLNLSRNMLRGSILGEIGQLKMLDSLDLSTNLLSGEIPKSMVNLSFLCVLNLSNNNLSGKIPLSTQLQSFDNTSYLGNPGLCGAPLSKCPGDEAARPRNTGDGESSTERDEGWFEPLWFFTGVTAGFLVGFWGVFGTLLINRSWRHRYFQLLNKLGDWIKLTLVMDASLKG